MKITETQATHVHSNIQHAISKRLKTREFTVKKVESHPLATLSLATRHYAYRITVSVDGREKRLTFNKSDFHRPSVCLPIKSSFDARKTLDANHIADHHFADAFTCAASQTRSGYIMLIDEKVVVVSKIWWVFLRFLHNYGFFQKTFERYCKTNQATAEAYREFLIRECGQEKLEQIEDEYGISIDDSGDTPLEASLVYKYNMGMNSIEEDEIEALKAALEQGDIRSMPHRWQRNLRRLGIKTQDDFYALYIETISSSQESVDRCVEIITPPLEDLDNAYTGRKITHKAIGGHYADPQAAKSKVALPWQDQQELMQLYEELQELKTSKDEERRTRHYTELLIKAAIKKHLFRKGANGHYRSGVLLPSPWKDREGRTAWMRVDATLSPLGKIAYTIRPAREDAPLEIPVLRLYRDTAKHSYAFGGIPTAVRDMHAEPGYLFADALEAEDKAFYKAYTIDPKHTNYYHGLKTLLSNGYKPEYGPTLDLIRAIGLTEATHLFRLATGTTRPLVIGGCSLGGFDAQYGMAHYLATSGRILAQDTRLYTNNTLRIKEEDNESFLAYLAQARPAMKAIKTTLTIDHIVGKHDPIPRACHGRTFLGAGLPDVSLRVVERLGRTAIAPELTTRSRPDRRIKDYHTHRYEGATEGIDIRTTVIPFDDYNNSLEGYLRHSRVQQVKPILQQKMQKRFLHKWIRELPSKDTCTIHMTRSISTRYRPLRKGTANELRELFERYHEPFPFRVSLIYRSTHATPLAGAGDRNI